MTNKQNIIRKVEMSERSPVFSFWHSVCVLSNVVLLNYKGSG
jgi:hypothetical protein